MTKTLLINCYQDSAEINQLTDALNKFTVCKVVPYTKIHSGYQLAEDISAVVVSGSEARITKPEDKAKYDGVIQLIQNCKVPLLGICFGHQLLCSAFGAKTAALKKPVINKFEQVNIIQTGDILSRFRKGQTVPLAEYHNDYVLKDSLDGAGFNLLADSASCEVEAVKHKSKLFFGVQFHPERITIGTESHPEGYRILDNFYCNNVKRLGI
ncbi:MAG: gamma-glutamyl-gamma-aminobutyrate hydrolase family protein [Candidatus Bathyarchaeota archaeon]|nr:gamma-glutamyl-gamma-aminobutyrate hydrolase family protein [Candidatus Bathyarchaeota archaeon]